jgi:ubiquitin C-terminal hydrolase
MLYKKKFNLNDILSISLPHIIPKSSRGGLVGLRNLGNTCFMNSALQCLSSCEELTKYFLLKKYTEETNRINKYGSGGKIAKAYYELLSELWTGVNSYLSPYDFRQIFIEFAKQFAGFSQHDSHEMLAFMLDALHEDLNRVKDKPYFELKEKLPEESEEQASNRWWKSHLSRENSIIVDLFHGQYKSKITCPSCKKISITYDPFMYLGLPIPQGGIRINFKFFPVRPEYECHIMEMSINETTTWADMKQLVISKFMVENIEGLVCLNKTYRRRLQNSTPILQFYEKDSMEVVVFETELDIGSPEVATFYVHPTEIIEERSFYVLSKKKINHSIFYPKPFTFSKSQNVKDLMFFLFRYYRKIFIDYPSEGLTYEDFAENIRNYDYTRNQFIEYFNKIEPFTLNIINNTNSQCDFCNKTCDYCTFQYDPNKTLGEVIQSQKVNRSFLLMMDVKCYNKERLFHQIDIKDCGKNLIVKKGEVNIYDCLDAFRTEEKLEKDNSWYCSTCKEHQEANKKLDIYKPPNILIIQFKRFKIKTYNMIMGMLSNKKNDIEIDFPIDDLDISKYVINENEKDEARYELFAISQHFGGLSSGHYTALCRNRGIWYNFDDERVTRASGTDVVSSAAYLLFYRKKCLIK